MWNARNQLTHVSQGGVEQLSYAYDAMDRRISKTLQGGTPMQYLYDADNIVQETQGSSINAILTGLGVDERFARNDVTGRTYFLTDQLNSTIALTDPTGAIKERYGYDPYGNVTLSDTTTGFTNPYQFMGREADTAGLYYYRARYYSPMTAGFISEDPARFAGGQLSFYAGFRGIHWTTTIHTDCGPSPSQLLMVLVVRLNLEKTLKRGNGFGVVDSGRVWKMALVLTRLENALVEMRHRVTEPLWGLMWKSGLRRDFGLGIPYKGLLV